MLDFTDSIELKGGTKMSENQSTIGEHARAYEPKQMKNIADLEGVSVDQVIKEDTRKDMNDEDYDVTFMMVPDKEGKVVEHRIPNSVLAQLKTMLKEKPDMKTFKVVKEGEGLNTKYTVIPLE